MGPSTLGDRGVKDPFTKKKKKPNDVTLLSSNEACSFWSAMEKTEHSQTEDTMISFSNLSFLLWMAESTAC